MLTLHSCNGSGLTIANVSGAMDLPKDIVWIDLFDPTPDEVAFVERCTSLHVPGVAELSEIENSSRLRTKDGALFLSTPIVIRSTGGMASSSVVGFVLTKDMMVTIRFSPLMAFTTFAEQAAVSGVVLPSSIGAFVGLIDALVDRLADVLEGVGADLDLVSLRVFRADGAGILPHRPAKEDTDLRDILRRIGRNGDFTSKIRDSLLGLGRIVPYVAAVGSAWISPELKQRLDIQRQDVASLNDYDAHLSSKVQLLLDATLGLINIEQNNIIKVLTIVSVVGVPPTLVASLYGMNFHNMPELNWSFGYQYGLAMIALSAIGPLVWFKIRGWL